MTDRDSINEQAERVAYEAEMRYARTGLTIDAERAVQARHAVPAWIARMQRQGLPPKDLTGQAG